MAEFHNAGESIECGKCEIIAKKFVPSSPQIHSILGKVIKYECSRNSSAKILEELDPKEFKVYVGSHLNLNDTLKAETLYAYTTYLKRVKTEVVNYTGRHKANVACIYGFTLAQIRYPLENVLNAIQKRKELL